MNAPPTKLAVITCYSTPIPCERRRSNYVVFRDAMMRQGAKMFTVEHVMPGREPELTATGETIKVVKGGACLWNKEADLNIAIKMVPPEYDAIAWIDADLLFTDDQWQDKTLAMLQTNVVGQIFNKITYLDRKGNVEAEGYSFMTHRKHSGRGGAWAAQRWLLDKHGIYPYHIVGGGDSYYSWAAAGRMEESRTLICPPKLIEHFNQWADGFVADVAGRCGFSPNDVLHLWHGDRVNRKYTERHQILMQHAFDPAMDVKLDADGLLQWSSNKPGLHHDLFDYFVSRREDGWDSSGILTCADEQYFGGLPELVQSIRDCDNSVPISCVDLGMNATQRASCDDLNVQVLAYDWSMWKKNGLDDRSIKLWIKPFLMSLSPYRKTLWLDADTLVLRDLHIAFNLIGYGPLVTPDQGGDYVRNSPALYRAEGVETDGHQIINAGVVGMDLERDHRLLKRWQGTVEKAMADAAYRRNVRLHDQGALLLAAEAEKVRVQSDWRFNHRPPNEMIDLLLPGPHLLEFLREEFPTASILHFPGQKKYWNNRPGPNRQGYAERKHLVRQACSICPYFNGKSNSGKTGCEMSRPNVSEVAARVAATELAYRKRPEKSARMMNMFAACPTGKFAAYGTEVASC